MLFPSLPTNPIYTRFFRYDGKIRRRERDCPCPKKSPMRHLVFFRQCDCSTITLGLLSTMWPTPGVSCVNVLLFRVFSPFTSTVPKMNVKSRSPAKYLLLNIDGTWCWSACYICFVLNSSGDFFLPIPAFDFIAVAVLGMPLQQLGHLLVPEPPGLLQRGEAPTVARVGANAGGL